MIKQNEEQHIKILENKIAVKRSVNHQIIPTKYQNITRNDLRPFQRQLAELADICDGQKINFIYDKCGNTGKSFCANYL